MQSLYGVRSQRPQVLTQIAIMLSLILCSFGQVYAQGWYRTYSDLTYIQSGTTEQRLDVHMPILSRKQADKFKTTKAPVLVYIHGGSWQTGDKSEIAKFTKYFKAENGLPHILVSVNYRLAPRHKHPAQVMDVAAALAWVYKNIPRYGGDRSRISVMGHSSGAHLAALVMTDSRYLKQRHLEPAWFEKVILLDAVAYSLPHRAATAPEVANLLIKPVFGNSPLLWSSASPSHQVDEDDLLPRMLLVCNGAPGISMEQTQIMANALDRVGASYEIFHAHGYTHEAMFTALDNPWSRLSRNVSAFLHEPELPAIHRKAGSSPQRQAKK